MSDKDLIRIWISKRLHGNPYQYDLHAELLVKLKEELKFQALRDARENFSKYFPLTEALWTEWIEDEARLAMTVEEKKNVLSLYKRALEDYTLPRLCASSIEFVTSQLTDCDDYVSLARSWCEDMILVAGLDVQFGRIIWRGYIKFEEELYGSVDENQKDSQKKIVSDLYRRVISLPLVNMDAFLSEFYTWSSENDLPKDWKPLCKKAKEDFTSILDFENKILSHPVESDGIPSDVLFVAWQDYISYEFKNGNLSRVRSLYERMISSCFLQPDAWKSYILFNLKSMPDLINLRISVTKRAIRNCPGLSLFWVNSIRFYAETVQLVTHREIAIIEKIFSDSMVHTFTLSDSLDIHLACIDIYRIWISNNLADSDLNTLLEHLNSAISRTFILLETPLPEYRKYASDPYSVVWSQYRELYCNFLKYSIHMELKFSKMENKTKTKVKVREWLNKWINQITHRDWKAWMDYIDFETNHGDLSIVSSLFKRAMNMASADSLDQNNLFCKSLILREWSIWEHNHGTLESIVHVQAVSLDFDLQASASARIGGLTQNSNFSENSTEDNPRSILKKRNREPESGGVVKKKKVATEEKNHVVEKTVATVEELHSILHDDKTVFIKNLPYSMDETMIAETFGKAGTVTHVRMKHDRGGLTKGWAHVVFSSHDECKVAIEMFNGKLTFGRSLHVELSNPPPLETSHEHKVPADSDLLNVPTVFVKGLPMKLDSSVNIEHMLQLHFESCGEIISIRVPRDDSGIRGIAYIEFSSSDFAEKALLLDGQVLKGTVSTLKIQKSKFTNNSKEAPKEIELVKVSPANMFIPRTMVAKKKIGIARDVKNISKNVELSSNNTNPSETKDIVATASVGMSNNDFRNKFLSK